MVAQQKAWLDSHPHTDPALAVPLRVLKVAEEAGEAAAALIGLSGQNPRKGTSHTTADLAAELCDVIMAASVALATVVPDAEETLNQHAGRLYLRSREAGAPPLDPPGTGMDRTAWAAALPKMVASGSMLCADANGRILLVRQSYRGTGDTVWSVPGGGLEEGESPAQGARRETLEEIGLDIPPGRLLMLDWRPRDGARPPLAQYVFDGGTLTDADIARIRLQESEIAEYGFFDLDAARDRLAPHTFERLTRALAVRDGREALQDLVEGVPRLGGAG